MLPFHLMPIANINLNDLRARILSAALALFGRSEDTKIIVRTLDKGLQGLIAVGKDHVDVAYMNAIANLMKAEALLTTAQAEVTKAQATARRADAEFIKAEAMRDYLRAAFERERSAATWAEAEAERARTIWQLLPLLREALDGQMCDFITEIEQPMLRLLLPKSESGER